MTELKILNKDLDKETIEKLEKMFKETPHRLECAFMPGLLVVNNWPLINGNDFIIE